MKVAHRRSCHAVVLQVRELTDITANKMALLPFYARITATLGQVFSSIADGVVAGLERSFRYYKVCVATTYNITRKHHAVHWSWPDLPLAQVLLLQARKDNDARNVERRAVNACYLAELIKFRCMPFGAFFVLLKVIGPSQEALTANCSSLCAQLP